MRRTEITRLGEGVDERHRLLPLPVARVRNCLTDYRREAERLGAERTLLVATSAVRDAENGEAFLGEVEWSYGFTTRLLTGDEEAELMLRGVGAIEPGTLVLDIGGGSTELVTLESRTSLDVGAVRLTERFLHADPPTGDELEACAQSRPRSSSPSSTRRARSALPERSRRWRRSTSGSTSTTASAFTGTSSRSRASSGSSRASQRSRSPSGARCPRSSRSARR